MKSGEKHHNWKGNEAGYASVHEWLRNNHGTHAECENCGTFGFIEYANKRKIYIRDLNEWLKLCRSCHSKYDEIHRNLADFNAHAMARRKATTANIKTLLEEGCSKREIASRLNISYGHVFFLIKQGGL